MRFRAYFCTTAVGLTLAASMLSAQPQQTGQTGSGGTAAGGTTNPGGNGTSTNIPGNTGNNTLNKGNPGQINTSSTNRQLPPKQQQILTITGTVVLDDGAPPPMGAVIERECGGRKIRETSVSPNGSYAFQIGASNISNLLPDASDSGDMLAWEPNRTSSTGFPLGMMNPATSITGCELRAQLGGYRSSTILLTSNQAMGIMEVGTIVLYPASRVKGTTVSVTGLAAPKDARKALERAEKAYQKKKLDEAEKNAKAALQAYPNFAAAWYELGRVYVQSKRIEEAKSAYAKAVEADANYVNPYIELARLAGAEAQWEETVRLTDRALDLDPIDFPYGYFMNAVANYNLGRLETAEKSALKLNQIDSLHRWPQIHLVLASILHRRHDYGAEVVQLRAYLKYAPQSPDASEVRSRLNALEKGSIN